jgi:hypothetical protein
MNRLLLKKLPKPLDTSYLNYASPRIKLSKSPVVFGRIKRKPLSRSSRRYKRNFRYVLKKC